MKFNSAWWHLPISRHNENINLVNENKLVIIAPKLGTVCCYDWNPIWKPNMPNPIMTEIIPLNGIK